MELLSAALSPTITDFSFEFDSEIVESIIPNPKEMPFILKNEPVNIFVLLKPGFEGSARFALSYRDSATKRTHLSELFLEEKLETNYPFIEKMAQHRKVTLICDALRKSKPRIDDDALTGEIGDLRAYVIKESVHHQVLC